MNEIVQAGLTIVMAIIGLAIISTLVSRKANTAGVLQAGASALGTDLGVAESPVTGVPYDLNLSYPAPNSMGYGFGG